jgi:hypothetical protein
MVSWPGDLLCVAGWRGTIVLVFLATAGFALPREPWVKLDRARAGSARQSTAGRNELDTGKPRLMFASEEEPAGYWLPGQRQESKHGDYYDKAQHPLVGLNSQDADRDPLGAGRDQRPRPFPPGLVQPPRGTGDPRQTRRSRRVAAIRSLIVTRPACQPRSGNWTPARCSRLDCYGHPRLLVTNR